MHEVRGPWEPDLRLDTDVHIKNGQRSEVLNHGFALYGLTELITDQK